jgi:2-C-methyl-D-erythritol 2,4-cyclodiphosphate synthase
VHPFSDDADRPLVLGGVVVPGERGLAGHSDADVVAHALADGVLGAAGLGDIGTHFPADRGEWAGADSMDLLARCVAMVADHGWRPVNAHGTVIAERPRLAGHLAAMAARCAAVIGAPVAVTAKRAEGLGALGRVEGMACLSVVLLAAEGAVGDRCRAGTVP